MTTKDICKSALFVAAAFSVCAVSMSVVDFLSALKGDLSSTLGSVRKTSQDASDAVALFKQAEKAQAQNWLDTSNEARHTGQDLRRTVAHFDRVLTNFDVATLPAVNSAIVSNGNHLSVSIDKVGAAADELGAALADPNIKISFAQIAEASTQLANSSKQIAEASGHANKILADGEVVSDHYEKIVMKPVSLARRVGEYVLSFGADARVLFQGK